MMDPILTVRYTPEKRDYVQASRTLSKKSPWFLILAAVILLVVVGSGVLLVFPNLGGDGFRNVLPFLFVGGLVYLLYFFFLIPIQLNKAFKSNEYLRMDRRLDFLESHLAMQVGDNLVELSWKHLQKVIDGREYILMLFKGDEQVFPFIPARALDHERARETLFEFFREKSIPVI